MPITVVGSIAYDTVKTPFGERERMLGGAAVHFALAASFFDDVRVVGPVGEDFGEEQLAVMRAPRRGRLRRRARERRQTFFWQGEYGWDLNSRETLDTQLGVFEGFAPKLSERSRSSDVLFLANIQPELQQQVRAQLPEARFVALDSMNLWIDIARDALVARDRERRLRDPQRRRAAPADRQAEPRLRRPRDPLLVAARRRRRAAPAWSSPSRASTAPRSSRARASSRFPPTRWRPSSTRPAPATRSRAGSSATSPRTPHEELSDELLRRAMAHATVLASFNVEEFGTERMRTADRQGDRRAHPASCTR